MTQHTDHSQGAASQRPPGRAFKESVTDDICKITLTAAARVLDDVPVWAWSYNGKGRIQLGTLALYAGRPGAGKSTHARWKAAGYSRGTLDGCFCGQPVNVAYIAGEESIKYTIKPGLRAAGADLDRIFFPSVKYAEHDMPLLAGRDEIALTKKFIAAGIKVVFVDPVMSTIGSAVDLHRSNEVRPVIEPWARMADAIDGVVYGIVHLNKAATGDVVAGVNGSSAFGEVARAIFGFAKDPDSDDGIRIMSQAKNSTGDEDLALEYKIESTPITTDSGKSAEVGRFVIIGDSDRTVGDVLRQAAAQPSRRSGRTLDILTYVLTSNEPVSPKDVAEELQINNDTAGKYLRRLADERLIHKTQFGHFTKPVSEHVEVSEVSESSETEQKPTSEPVQDSDTTPTIPAFGHSDIRTHPLEDCPILTAVPGGITAHTPGMTDRVKDITNRTNRLQQTGNEEQSA